MEQNYEFEKQVPDFSSSLEGNGIADIDASCFGGTCIYRGYYCSGGEVLFNQEGTYDGHIDLLEKVGFDCSGPFAPFERGFFEGLGSGGFR